MEWQDYERNIKTLASWYNRKLNDKQHDILYQQVQSIPAPAFRDIVESLINDSKYFPTIQEIKNRYMAWRAQNPSQVLQHEKTNCLDCHGKGFIWAMKYDQDMQAEYEYVYRCGSCKNWTDQASHKAMAQTNRLSAGLKIVFPKEPAKSEDDLIPRKTKGNLNVFRKVLSGTKIEAQHYPKSEERSFHTHPKHKDEADRLF